MPSIARRLRRSRPFSRAAVASLSAIFAIGLLGVLPVVAVPATPGPGFQDFQYNIGPEEAPGGDAVTGSRNQSKVWFNDGKWWGMLFDKTNATDASYRIQSLNWVTQTWTTGNTATQADKRNKSHADVLSDGNTLWVVSSHKSGTNVPPNGDLRVYKFSYSTTTKKYTAVDLDTTNAANLFKIVAQGGTDAATIAKAPNGRIWVAYTQDDASPATTSHVRVVASLNATGVNSWTPPQELVGGTSPINNSDLAAIVAVNNGVGVFWSNATVGDEAYYFQVHLDASGDTTWQTRETAYNGSAGADGHMSVKVDATGQVLAAVKTKGTTTEPLIGVLRRTTGGTWQAMKTVADSTGTPDPTRPILVIDEENSQADVFMTSQVDGGFITRRTADLTTLDFGSPSAGTAFIKSTADSAISDATSSKQAATLASGLLVLASDRRTGIRRYLHGCAGSVCPAVPVAAFSGTPLTGNGPLTVNFTDESTGNPATWAWDFGDGGTSNLQNPIHAFNPGSWTVSLTVTNVLGSDAEIKTSYVVVSVPPGARYTAIIPERVLSSRDGIGLSGVFHAGTGRDFQVTNGGTIPNDAVAVTGNLTVTQQTKLGYVILAPTAGATTSTINFPVGDNRANGVTVALGPGGKLNAIYKATAGATVHLIFDVTGYFRTSVTGATFTAIIPERVLSSRDGIGLSGVFHAGTGRDFQVTNGGTIPNDAVAVTGNLTVTQQTKLGYVILAPTAGATTSTINFPVGDNRANGVTVALGPGGKLNAIYKATAGATVHLIFDVTGYFKDGGGGQSWYPLSPERVLSSRDGIGLSGVFHAGTGRDFQVTNGGTIPNDAVAVTGNLTVTQQTKLGYVILAPTAGATTSTINFPVGDNRANGVTVALSSPGGGGFRYLNAVYKATAGATVHLIFDVTGYFK